MSNTESDVPAARHHKKCHMLMTMQKLFQSRAYNQGPFPSSSVVRAEPQPVVQLPTLDPTGDSPFASTSLFSLSSPAEPPPEEPPPPAATPTLKLSRQLSLRIRRSKMSLSDLKSQHQASKVDLIDDSRSSHSASTREKSVWNANDSFLPRAKPPPPLKLVPKERKSSKSTKNSKSPSDPPLSVRPSSPHHGPGQELLKSRLMGARPTQRMIDRPVLEQHGDVVDVRQSLTRSSTQMTTSSEASTSHVTLDVPPPDSKCAWGWRPPASWSGPHETTLADKDNTPKPGGFGFINRKRTKSVASRGGTRDHLKNARPSDKVACVQLADVLEPEEIATVVRAQKVSVARAEVVEVQCYKGWDKKPAADVIHELRELKSR